MDKEKRAMLLKHAIKNAGWTQRELAYYLNMDESRLSQKIIGKTGFNLRDALRLKFLLNMTEEDFLHAFWFDDADWRAEARKKLEEAPPKKWRKQGAK